MNDLPLIINNESMPILFAADTSIIFTYSNFTGYRHNIRTAFETSNTWFKENLLSLSVEKAPYTPFITKKDMSIYRSYGM